MRARIALLAALPLLLAASAPPRPLALVDLGGAPVALAPAPGERALVVHFWATWCPECVRELPTFGRAAARCPGVRFVTVNVGETPTEIERYRSAHPIDLPVLRDPKGDAWRSVARALPANLVWSAQERHTVVGTQDEEDWVRALGCEGGGAR